MYLSELNFGQALVIAVVGLVVVFVVLVILMSLIKAMSAAIGSAKKKEEAPAPAPAVAPAPAAAPAAPAGLTLENVSEKEAALIMAIVADEMKKDPAELNFISIKEVK